MEDRISRRLRTGTMSTCAFCGVQSSFGSNLFAHRITPRRTRTVKVCPGCIADANEAGYRVAEREPSTHPTPSPPKFRRAS